MSALASLTPNRVSAIMYPGLVLTDLWSQLRCQTHVTNEQLKVMTRCEEECNDLPQV